MKSVIVVLYLFTAVAVLTPAVSISDVAVATKNEVILGMYTDFEKKEIKILVRSFGCTEKADILVSFDKNQMIVSRINPDNCRMAPTGKEIIYTLEEIGLNPDEHFSVRNSFVVAPGAANR